MYELVRLLEDNFQTTIGLLQNNVTIGDDNTTIKYDTGKTHYDSCKNSLDKGKTLYDIVRRTAKWVRLSTTEYDNHDRVRHQ